MHIRPASPDDALAIETIRVRVAVRVPPCLSGGRARCAPRRSPSGGGRACTCRRPVGATSSARSKARVVGFASTGPSRDEDEIGELYAIYVDPQDWSTGAGRALMAAAEQRLAADYDAALLWVLEDNPRARGFYERAGWAPDGVRKAEERFGVRAAEVRYRKDFA